MRRDTEGFALSAAAEIAIDQESARAGESEGDGEIGGDRRFAFVRHGAGDEEGLRARSLIGHEEDGRTDVAIRFREDVARVVRLEQGDFALGFLPRDLAEDVLGEVMLKLAERSHPVVDPIEEQEDRDTRERAATETR